MVPITDTIAVEIARIKAPHQGTSDGGGGAESVEADILFLLDT
jgi:hypothetical protein